MFCCHDLPLEYAPNLVYNLQNSACLQLSLDLIHALHEKSAWSDFVYVLHHEDIVRHPAHYLLDTNETLDSDRDQFHGNLDPDAQ